MAGIRSPLEDSELSQARIPADLISDDDRSFATDSWSIQSDYGSTFDDEQRHIEASDLISSVNLRAASDYSNSDKDEPDAEVANSMLGLQSYWDAAYTNELANFHEHDNAGEVWFGVEVMELVTAWTKNLCCEISQHHMPNLADDVTCKSESVAEVDKDLSSWSVLDIGTGNGLLLQEFAKKGFSDLTGIDYSEGAIDLAKKLADRDRFSNINFLVDDVLKTKLERQFELVMDKGTLDVIGMQPDGPIKRTMYWESISKLVTGGGILVITSCNSTKDELVQEVGNFNQSSLGEPDDSEPKARREMPPFRYLNHVETYPTFIFREIESSCVATVAFLRS